MWPDHRLMDLLNIKSPIVQAPMAGANGSAMVIETCKAGGLGSLPCAMLSVEKMHAEIGIIRQQTNEPINVNFFVHKQPEIDLETDENWLKRLSEYYSEFELDLDVIFPEATREPFGEDACAFVEKVRPEIISFHFGLPEIKFLDRVRVAGCKVISSATTVEEACWLEERGCDAIIAQGYEAGGHRAMFLSNDINTQVGTMSLVPQVVDAVSIPVIAAGGIADGRGITAAFALGAAGVQIGTPYLFTPEALVSELHLSSLKMAKDNSTAITNIFSGRPARSIMNRIMRDIGPMSDWPTSFPNAGSALAPLKRAAETEERSDFSSLWSGQSVGLSQEMGTADLTRKLANDALGRFSFKD
jgi:nitronate monooxygenase